MAELSNVDPTSSKGKVTDDKVTGAPALRDFQPLPGEKNASLTEDDLMEVVSAAVDHEGLAGHNINSFNDLMNDGIPQILTDLFNISIVVKDEREQTEMDKQRKSIKIAFWFSDVKIGRPVMATYPIGKIKKLLPNEARLSRRTYAAPLTLAAEVELTAYYADGHEEKKRATIPPFQVAPIPVMVGSDRCHTWNLTREGRKNIEEDPADPGGYFVAKGGEYVVEWLENVRYNSLHVHARVLANERVRGEFIAQPGGAFENSSQVIIRLMTSGAISIEINSTKFKGTRIPFFVLFRLLGMASDADVRRQIVFDPASKNRVVTSMQEILDDAFRHRDPTFDEIHDELDREKIVRFLAVRLATFVQTKNVDDEDAIRYLNSHLLTILDQVFLNQMGDRPADRGAKLRYLGMLIHKTLLVDLGILEPTDRDSFANKRVHGAGVSLAKAFKTQFNNSIRIPVLRALKREVRNTPFEELSIPNVIDAFKNPMASGDLSRTMEQALTSGNKTIVVRMRTVTNRVSTQALERKNMVNVYSALRSVSTQNPKKTNKGTTRADQMRRVHQSYPGYICVVKSADTGEMVGLKKELGITAGICSAGETFPLKRQLRADPAVIPLDRVAPAAIARENLARIYVNGEWVGCCRAAHRLVDRYRALRRVGQGVDPRATIAWNPVTDDVDFWLDVGRVTRPLLIVDNNLAEYDAACRKAFAAKKAGEKDWARHRVPFFQNISLTPAHVEKLRAGTLTLEDLREEGVVEWVTPEEAENCLVAPSLTVLRRAQRDVTTRYTHCDIQQALFGLTALISPFGGHTQPARVTYETNQGRQAGGWYCLAAPFRVDKNRFFQHYCEAPLVDTITSRWLPPNGMNTRVAYMTYKGYNQEDSAVVSAGFVQRGGFEGTFYRYERLELEKGEEFKNPDATVTKNIKPNASYEKLVNGFVQAGTTVVKGDVLIGRVGKIQPGRHKSRVLGAPDSHFQFVDRSLVYHLDEPAEVVAVYRPRGANDNVFGLVKLRYNRPLTVGDKMSSRAGNKAIDALIIPDCDMPYDDDGVTPDIIINTHSVPSRMTVGQMIETTVGDQCEEEGVQYDATTFRNINLGAIADGLVKSGRRYNACSRLFDGATGVWYDAAIFVGNTYHQRLQKFVKDDEYAVGSHGPTDALTGQPLDGKNARGGLRLGEMENWVLESQGAVMNMTEKMFEDSDGRKYYVCRGCGRQAICNPHQGIYKCNVCTDAADIVEIDSCKAAIVFQQEVRSANINMRLGLKPREFEKRL